MAITLLKKGTYVADIVADKSIHIHKYTQGQYPRVVMS